MEIMNIGSKIEEIVRVQGLSITDFARKINCVRKNVYDIFKRNSIDIGLLYRISKVLNHNFFQDLAEDTELAQPLPVDSDEDKLRNAVQDFLDFVPGLASEVFSGGTIVLFPQKYVQGIPMPDYILGPYMVTFTIGETMQERLNGKLGDLFEFTPYIDNNGNSVLLVYSKYDKKQMIDIKIDCKSKEQWRQTLEFAFQVAKNEYSKETKQEIKRAMFL